MRSRAQSGVLDSDRLLSRFVGLLYFAVSTESVTGSAMERDGNALNNYNDDSLSCEP